MSSLCSCGKPVWSAAPGKGLCVACYSRHRRSLWPSGECEDCGYVKKLADGRMCWACYQRAAYLRVPSDAELTVEEYRQRLYDGYDGACTAEARLRLLRMIAVFNANHPKDCHVETHQEAAG